MGSVAGPGVIAAIVMMAATGVFGATSANTPPLDSCEALRSFRQPDVVIVDASLVPAGQLHKSDSVPQAQRPTKAYRRVEARIEGNIGFLTWLPLREDWNGRVLGIGNGGDAGSFAVGGIARAVREGMVGTTTDAGHQGDTDPLWAMSRKKMEDYTHRAQHLTAAPGQRPHAGLLRKGSQQVLLHGLFRRRPAGPEGDADLSRMTTTASSRAHRPHSTPSRWPASSGSCSPGTTARSGVVGCEVDTVQAEVVRQCDAVDGLADGLTENPLACKFDVTTLACKPGQTGDTCLTPAQIGMVNLMYGPFKDENGVERGPRRSRESGSREELRPPASRRSVTRSIRTRIGSGKT